MTSYDTHAMKDTKLEMGMLSLLDALTMVNGVGQENVLEVSESGFMNFCYILFNCLQKLWSVGRHIIFYCEEKIWGVHRHMHGKRRSFRIICPILHVRKLSAHGTYMILPMQVAARDGVTPEVFFYQLEKSSRDHSSVSATKENQQYKQTK